MLLVFTLKQLKCYSQGVVLVACDGSSGGGKKNQSQEGSVLFAPFESCSLQAASLTPGPTAADVCVWRTASAHLQAASLTPGPTAADVCVWRTASAHLQAASLTLGPTAADVCVWRTASAHLPARALLIH